MSVSSLSRKPTPARQGMATHGTRLSSPWPASPNRKFLKDCNRDVARESNTCLKHTTHQLKLHLLLSLIKNTLEFFAK